MSYRQDVAVEFDLHACQGIQQQWFYQHIDACQFTRQALSFIHAYAQDLYQERQYMHACWAARSPCQHFPQYRRT